MQIKKYYSRPYNLKLACDKYSGLLHGELHLVQSNQDNDQDV